jgi:chromatin segregation and condensation protein Rec8/ScpA/Scc1 (kleisin family)
MSISMDPVTVVERMRTVVDTLKAKGGGGTFAELLGEAYDRRSVIGVFVAVLELCRRGMLSVAQEGVCGEIRLSLSESPYEALSESPYGALSESPEGASAPIEDEAVEVAA